MSVAPRSPYHPPAELTRLVAFFRLAISPLAPENFLIWKHECFLGTNIPNVHKNKTVKKLFVGVSAKKMPHFRQSILRIFIVFYVTAENAVPYRQKLSAGLLHSGIITLRRNNGVTLETPKEIRSIQDTYSKTALGCGVFVGTSTVKYCKPTSTIRRYLFAKRSQPIVTVSTKLFSQFSSSLHYVSSAPSFHLNH